MRRFIYETSLITQMTKDDFKQLSEFLILCRGEQVLKPIRQCYLKPSEGVPDNMIIADGYYQSNYDYLHWSKFLIQLNIQTRIGFTASPVKHVADMESYINDENYSYKLEHPKIFADYLSYIREQMITNKPQPNAETIRKGGLLNFIWCDFIHLLNMPGYWELFWRAVQNDWQQLATPSYFYRDSPSRSNNRVPNFIFYYVSTQPCIPVLGATYFSHSSHLFAPILREELEGLPLPFADLPEPLTMEQSIALGFKTELSAVELLDLLQNLYCRSSPDSLRKIYLYLLQCPTRLASIDIVKWKANNFLYANDQTLQPAQNLAIYDSDVPAPAEAKWLHPCGLNTEQLRQLANILKLPMLSTLQGQYTCIPNLDHRGNEQKLYQLILRYLPALAALDGQQLPGLLDKFQELVIQASDIEHKTDKRIKIHAVYENGTLYYTGRWNLFAVTKAIIAILCQQVFGFSKKTQTKFEEYASNKKHYTTESEEINAIYNDLADFDIPATTLNDLYSTQKALCPKHNGSLTTAQPTDDLSEQLGGLSLGSSTADTANPWRSQGLFGRNHPHAQLTLQDNIHAIASPYQGYPQSPLIDRRMTTTTSGSPIPFLLDTTPKSTPKRKPTTPISPHDRTPKSPMSDYERRRIGRKGEQIVYERLLEHYTNKYCDRTKYPNANVFKFQDPNKLYKHGFQINGFDSAGKTVELTVTWYNQNLVEQLDKDWGFDHDIKIVKNGAKRYIEVKATKTTDLKEFSLSSAEWKRMQSAGSRYRIFRVYDVDNEQRQPPVKIKDPATRITDGTLKIQKVHFKY